MMTYILLILDDLCDVVIQVLSFAFQISGAVLLLLWSLGKCDTRIKDICLNDGVPSWGAFDEHGTYSVLGKDTLRRTAKTVYRNIFAFADIIIGYALAIFITDTVVPNWVILILVAFSTAVILMLEYIATAIIAAIRYRHDEKVYDKKQ